MEPNEIVSAVMRFFYGGRVISKDVDHHELFRLFKQGYPEVSENDIADAIFDDLNDRGAELDAAQETSLQRLTVTWSEWTFAWENYDSDVAHGAP